MRHLLFEDSYVCFEEIDLQPTNNDVISDELSLQESVDEGQKRDN